jgi:hypothetical protein
MVGTRSQTVRRREGQKSRPVGGRPSTVQGALAHRAPMRLKRDSGEMLERNEASEYDAGLK